MDIVSPRLKTQPAVYIVTCTSGLGSCQVDCKEEFWDCGDKSLLFHTAEGESLRQWNLESTFCDLLYNSLAETLLF